LTLDKLPFAGHGKLLVGRLPFKATIVHGALENFGRVGRDQWLRVGGRQADHGHSVFASHKESHNQRTVDKVGRGILQFWSDCLVRCYASVICP